MAISIKPSVTSEFGSGHVSVDSDGFLHFVQEMLFSEPRSCEETPKEWSETNRFSCHPMHLASLKTHRYRDQDFVVVSVRDGAHFTAKIHHNQAMEAWTTAKRRWLERLRETNMPYGD